MSTEAQIAANQRNAHHSTGPKSAESKSRICLNAFRHGLGLRTQAEVDHRILPNMNMQTSEHRITIGPDRIRAAEKAA